MDSSHEEEAEGKVRIYLPRVVFARIGRSSRAAEDTENDSPEVGLNRDNSWIEPRNEQTAVLCSCSLLRHVEDEQTVEDSLDSLAAGKVDGDSRALKAGEGSRNRNGDL